MDDNEDEDEDEDEEDDDDVIQSPISKMISTSVHSSRLAVGGTYDDGESSSTVIALKGREEERLL